MVPIKANGDEYIASALPYIRFAFGGGISDLTGPDDVVRLRSAKPGRRAPMIPADLRQPSTRCDE